MAAWRHAYGELVTERYPSLLAYATLLTSSDDEAEAVTRASIVTVFGRLRPPSGDEAEAVVRQKIVKRAASGRWAAKDRRREIDTESDDAGAGADAAHDESTALARLRALDRVTRACVVLRHADGLPVAAVAARLRLTPEDVRARLGEAGDRMGGLVDVDSAEDDVMFIEVHGARRHG